MGKRTFAFKQQHNKRNVAILHEKNKKANGSERKARNTAVLRTLELLSFAAIKANVRFSTERKTNEMFATLHFPRLQDQYCNAAKAGGQSVADVGASF